MPHNRSLSVSASSISGHNFNVIRSRGKYRDQKNRIYKNSSAGLRDKCRKHWRSLTSSSNVNSSLKMPTSKSFSSSTQFLFQSLNSDKPIAVLAVRRRNLRLFKLKTIAWRAQSATVRTNWQRFWRSTTNRFPNTSPKWISGKPRRWNLIGLVLVIIF